MIKFVIDRIHLRNVRNYGDDGMDMDFPLGNLTVFTGHVGAGKSTILKSVSMALYGDDGGVKGEKLSIDDMVNERTGKNLEIELYFRSIDTLDNNRIDNYEIHLYHKHSKHQNKLVFIKNGVDISANGKMDTYRLIEKTLIPKDVYHNIYYFTQQAKNFFTALPNSEQKAIFDSILDLSDYDKYYQNCRTNITQYENLIEKSVLEINLLKSSVDEKDRLIEKEKSSIETLKQTNQIELEQLLNDASKLKKQLEEIQSQISLDFDIFELDKQLSDLQAKQTLNQNQFDHDIEILNSKIIEVKNSVQSEFNDAKLKAKEKLEPITKALEDQINDKKQEKLIQDKKLSDEIHILQNELISQQSQIKDKYSQRITDLKTESSNLLSQISTKKAEADKQASEIKSEAAELKSQRDTQLSSISQSLTQIKSKKNQILLDIESKTRIVKSNTKELESEHPHCDKCGQALVNLDHLVNENNKLNQEIDDLNKSNSECDKTIFELTAKQNEINKECETQLESLRDRFKNIAVIYNETKTQLETRIQEKNSELESITVNQNAELQQANEESSRKQESIKVEFKQKIDSIESDIKSLESDIELETMKIKQELVELSKVLGNKQAKQLAEIESSINSKRLEKNQKYEEINSLISVLRNKRLERQLTDNKINSLSTELNNKTVQIKLKTEYKPSEDTLKNLIESKQHDEDALKVQVKRHDDLKETLTILEFWKTAFSDSGIKSMLIDVAIPHMNRCVREELDRVCPGTFTVSFDTLSQTKSGTIRDKFAINITHNLKCATGHKKLSGGEKRIIDFCCMSALRSLAENLYGKMFCHIFYDEVLDSLDSECRELFCRSMKTQSSDERHVLLVTHALTEDVEPDRVFPF